MSEILRVEGLSKEFGGLTAVDGVNLTVNGGKIVGLVGPNGAGKTTLFNLISGFLAPSSGDMYFRGKRINRWSVRRRVLAGITRTFQKSRVFPGFSVRENVLTAAHGSGGGGEFYDEKDDFLDWLLGTTKLAGYGDRHARDLSFSYRRRLELTIAVATRPELLLLDEPFGGTGVGDLSDLSRLLQLLRDEGMTLLLVEHNISAVAGIADRLIYMEKGRLRIPNG